MTGPFMAQPSPTRDPKDFIRTLMWSEGRVEHGETLATVTTFKPEGVEEGTCSRLESSTWQGSGLPTPTLAEEQRPPEPYSV